MGKHINYRNNLLLELASNQHMVPSLFWALPTGSWLPHEIQEVWEYFTSGGNFCNDYGLLLIENPEDQHLQRAKANRFDAAKIHDLLRFPNDTIPKSITNQKGIFITSSVFPAYGYGLHISFEDNHENPCLQFCTTVIPEVITALNEEEISPIKELSKNYYQLKKEINKPIPDDEITKLKNSLKTVQGLISELKEFENILTEYNQLNVNKLVFPKSIFPDEIIKKLSTIIATEQIPDTSMIFRQPWNKIKCNLLTNLINGKDPGFAERALDHDELDNFNSSSDKFQWGRNYLCQHKATLLAGIQDYRKKLMLLILDLTEKKDKLSLSLSQLAERRKELYKKYSTTLNHGKELAKKEGAQFLAMLEKTSKNKSYRCNSLTWDPPRMVGWKIRAAGIDIKIADLNHCSNELCHETPLSTHNIQDSFNGDNLTDVIHFIYHSQTALNRREITLKILERLLLISNMERVRTFYHIEEKSPGASNLDFILSELGWKRDDKYEFYPLKKILSEKKTDLLIVRKSLENFCKDLLKVINKKYLSHYSNNALRVAIRNINPNISISLLSSNLEGISAGASKYLMEAYAELISPDPNGQPSKNLILISEHIAKVLKIINPDQHDSGIVVTDDDVSKVHVGLQNILTLAEEIILEMPWKFEVLNKSNDLPVILSGIGSSHSHAESKTIQIIQYDDEARHPSEILVWNPDKINPVMPNAIIL
jgi:HAMP domain-containing protein